MGNTDKARKPAALYDYHCLLPPRYTHPKYMNREMDVRFCSCTSPVFQYIFLGTSTIKFLAFHYLQNSSYSLSSRNDSCLTRECFLGCVKYALTYRRDLLHMVVSNLPSTTVEFPEVVQIFSSSISKKVLLRQ